MDSKKISSIAITIIFIAGAVYVFSKHNKETGFWWGVLAVMLMVSYVKWNDDAFKANLGGVFEASADNSTTSTT
jgi:hypothetical protein